MAATVRGPRIRTPSSWPPPRSISHETVVVGGGRDQSAAAGEQPGADLERVAEVVEGDQPARCERGVEAGQAVGVR